MYVQIASKAAAETNWVDGCRAEWTLGEIAERLGQVEAGQMHYERALSFLHDAPSTDFLRAKQEELGLLPNLAWAYEREGKMGCCAFAAHMDAAALLDLFWAAIQDAKGKSSSPGRGFSLDVRTFVFLTYATSEQAEWLQRVGQFEAAEQALRTLLVELEQRHQVQEIGVVQWELARQIAFFERFDEATALGQTMAAVPPEQRQPDTGPLQSMDYASWLAQRDGVSKRVWDEFNPALKHCKDSRYYPQWTLGRITKADLLARDGQVEAALVLLDEVILDARETKQVDRLADALRSRAKYKISASDLQPVADDLKESLGLYRTLGNKIEEVELYELYARWLGAQGRYAEALRTWEDAYQMCETLRLHFRSLHMLLGMADLQLRVGNKAELARIWERINKFVVAHKQLPDPTQLRLQLARMDYLKFQGDQQNLQAAYNQTIAFVKTSSLTSYQARSLNSYDLGQPIAMSTIGTQAEVAVDLQPVMMSTQVSTGELAHARFGIFNPSIRVARGSVKLLSANTRYQWTLTDQGWSVALSHGTAAGAGATKELTIPPGSATALYFEALPSTSGTTNRLSVTWQGESRAEANWEFSVSPDSRTVAIVNASLAADNPFYAVPFYHEMYFRGSSQELRNFRVKTSEPCRVEILDAATGKLLAIDANGDGNFDGPGDVLFVDEDGNGFPDFVVSNERDLAGFELLVYPASPTDRGQGEIEISLLIEENHAWIEQAVDKLKMK